jgi:hypothetical protein
MNLSPLRRSIESALACLKDQYILGIGRAADMATVTFGVPEVKTQNVFLHIQCPWRLEGDTGIITGRSDLFEPEDPKNAAWLKNPGDYDEYPNLQDAMLGRFHRDLEGGSRIGQVISIEVDSLGGFKIELSGALQLSVFPAGSRGEYWRLLRRDDKAHFVVPPSG